MYLKHYGLDEAPFSITPDPRFVFLSDRHREALAHLVYGISQGGGGGFVQLTGEVGTGKTTLSRLLLAQLPENTGRPDPESAPAATELLEAVCEELGIDLDAGPQPARGGGKRLVDALNRYLLQAHADGRRVVLMLDEAQELPVASLEQVRLLTNLETASQKLLQIVLLGQPELRDLLARPDLRQLAQRITARYHLTPLSAAETAAYVRHRLAVAGLARAPFEPAALAALHRRSGGVPRLINIIAERALLIGYGADLERLDAAVVRRAANEVLADVTSTASGGGGDRSRRSRRAARRSGRARSGRRPAGWRRGTGCSHWRHGGRPAPPPAASAGSATDAADAPAAAGPDTVSSLMAVAHRGGRCPCRRPR